MNLYLNNALVQSTSYNGIAPNWNSGSVFDFGAFEFQTFGGFYSSDDVIDEFTVATGPTGDTTPPVVSITAPTNGSYVNGGTIPVTANATDNVAVTGVQFNVDGRQFGRPGHRRRSNVHHLLEQRDSHKRTTHFECAGDRCGREHLHEQHHGYDG